jgi:hypothetical protein
MATLDGDGLSICFKPQLSLNRGYTNLPPKWPAVKAPEPQDDLSSPRSQVPPATDAPQT